jgi:hypothetical protein
MRWRAREVLATAGAALGLADLHALVGIPGADVLRSASPAAIDAPERVLALPFLALDGALHTVSYARARRTGQRGR